MNRDEILDVARRLAQALSPGDLDSTLARVTGAAVELLPEVECASITIKHADGRLETVAQTAEAIKVADEAQHQLREGPCYDAAVDDLFVTSPDLANDDRFPRYRAHAVAAGFRAQAGIRLFDRGTSRGALNLYSAEVGALADLDVLGRLFTHQSAIAIDYAVEVDGVREAVKTRGTIGQAVGILMERYRLDDARAFGLLVRLSQEQNVKVRLLAEDLVARSHEDYRAETG